MVSAIHRLLYPYGVIFDRDCSRSSANIRSYRADCWLSSRVMGFDMSDHVGVNKDVRCPGAYTRGDCGNNVGEDPYDLGLCDSCRLEVESDIRRTEAWVDMESEEQVD